LFQQIEHARGIVLIHLTTMGFDKYFASFHTKLASLIHGLPTKIRLNNKLNNKWE
ncbi:MAG: hypothetical protein ACI8W1_002862, partial [Candidatus Azotimanducaceae bacterium]